MLPDPAMPIAPAIGRPARLLARRTSAWQAPLAAASIVTVAAHLPVTAEHLREAPYIGALFVLLEVASLVLAAAVLLRPSRAVLLAIAGVGLLAVLALVVSRTVGLPLIGDDIGNWTEPLAVVSLAAESVMTFGGLVAGLQHGVAPRWVLRAGLVVGVLLLAAGGTATALAAGAEAAPTEDGTTVAPMQGDMGGMDMGLPAPGFSGA